MRVCVVGGTGNISTSIVRLLLETGHEVTVFNRGKTPGLPKGVVAIQGDRRENAAGFESAMQAEHFDAAIDMICFNAEQARSTLRAFRGVQHLIYCSTVATYGLPAEYDWQPITEDHVRRPDSDYGRNKLEADHVFMAAYHSEGFPVSIMAPAFTIGPQWKLPRQIGWDMGWIDRLRRGKPIVVCGDGRALVQLVHVDDAAPAFVYMLGRECCIGQTYNMMKRECCAWGTYHRAAMKAIGREVEMIGVPEATLFAARIPGFSDQFTHGTIYSPEKLMRDVPEFRPRISLEAIVADVLQANIRDGRIPDSSLTDWEDRLIAAQKNVGASNLVS